MASKPAVDIGRRIRQYREAQGMKLTALAEKCSISKGYLSSLEQGQGKSNPTLSVLRRIAGQLDVTLADLVGSPKRRAVAAPVEVPEEDLPASLRELVRERRNTGMALKPNEVMWLARAHFRGAKPTKLDYEMLLRVLREGGSQ